MQLSLNRIQALTLLFAAFVAAPTFGANSVDDVLERFANEPSVRDVQVAAMNYAETQPEQLSAYMAQTNYSKLLPRTRVRVDRQFDDDQGTTTNTAGETTTRVDTDDDTNVSVQAEWRLDELLMSSVKVRMIRENARLVELRDDVLDEVTKLYFDRRRLQVELVLAPPSDANNRVSKELRLQQLTAQIDALTGGFFSQRLGSAK